MDKYEFNIKVEQIKKMVSRGDYGTAMKIADTIDWHRVRNASLLSMIAQIYEKNEEYQEAKDILLLAFERAPVGKRLLYKLADLALKDGSTAEAEAYYREFCDLAQDDPRQYLLRYKILKAKKAPVDQLIRALEVYTASEVDEKWLYELAELYHKAGIEDKCVATCDRIMLLFGLGKYVDKAMELKLQYAPLTKYQMDLVENREKYEEKLRAVEEEYKNGTYRKPEPEGEYLDTDEPEAELDDEPENEPEGQPEQAEPEEKAGKPKAETKPADEKVEKAALDEDVVASLHEAQAEEALAKEVSKIKPYDEEEGASEGETRVFRNLRDLEPAEAEEKSEEAPIHEFEEEEETIVEDWDFEPEEEEEEIKESNHLMIEAEDPAAGLAMALDSLKKIHRELGTKHPVAKISGANLSHRGIASVAERLAGKDLVVEHAADLDDLTVEELEELMTQDETGMVVVLIDTQARLEQMHRAYPALAERFQYIGCENQKDDAAKLAQAREEELKRQQAQQEAEAARKRQAEREAEIRRQAEKEAEEKRRQQEAAARREEEERAKEEAQALAAKEAEEARKAEEDRRLAEQQREELRRQEEARRDDEPEYEDEEDHYEKDEYEPEDDYARGGYRDDYKDDYKDSYKDEREDDEYSNYPEDEPEEKPSKKSGDMDVEEFVQYACKYASEIDCSISGKSMLALYERAEMMEEDGEPLTKTSAEDLIEEAADKAEKKSFSGLFSSKYDKDGLLILKEKHFFD
mgnify:CR=1 FL=1